MTDFRQGAGRLCLDYVRTLRRRGKPGVVEELPDATALAAWVTQCGPLMASSLPSEAQVVRARRLREAVYRMVSGVALTAAERSVVNDAAALAVPAPWLNAAGVVSWRADDAVGATLALVARDAVDLVTSPAIGRVRACADGECSALFLDSSRPGTRRWCSMGVCGNRAKKHALRGV